MTISSQEEYLINLLREFKPFESILITKSQDGKPNRFLVKRSQQIMVNEMEIKPIAVKLDS